jgi:serine/threonine-protein kinase
VAHDAGDVELGRRAVERGLLDRAIAARILERATADGCGFLEAAHRCGLASEVQWDIAALMDSAAAAHELERGRSRTGSSGISGARLPEVGARLGGYVLERFIGKGAMGAVYQASADSGARRAIKVPMLEGQRAAARRERFQREARSLAKIGSHPGIVRVHTAGEDAGFAYCVLELIDGEPLDEVLKRGPVPVGRALEICEQVARALDHMHASGIIHRDLKPANVMIRRHDGSAVITDFGLARDEEAERMTLTGVMVGTPAYMPPEQARGARDVDARVDVYALGALLYELLTNRPPFIGDMVAEILAQVIDTMPDPPSRLRSGVPADVDAIVLRALSKERDDRYPTAAAMSFDIARVRAGERIEARRSTPLSAIATFAGRRQNRATVVALVVAACVVAAIVTGVVKIRLDRQKNGADADARRGDALAAWSRRLETARDDAEEKLARALRSPARDLPAALEAARSADVELERTLAAAPTDPEAARLAGKATEARRAASPALLLVNALDRARAGAVGEAARLVHRARVELGAPDGAEASFADEVGGLARTVADRPGRDFARAVVLLRARAAPLAGARAKDDARALLDALVKGDPSLLGEAWLELLGAVDPAALDAQAALLDELERRHANALAKVEIGPELIPLFEARSRRALASGDTLRAARLFSRVARCDPHALPPDDLGQRLAASASALQAGGRLDEVIETYLASLHAGILLPTPVVSPDELRDRLERMLAQDKDPSIRIYLADILFHSALKGRAGGTNASRATTFQRAQQLLRDVSDDTTLPLATRLKGWFLWGLALAETDRPSAIAALRRAHDDGYPEPDEVSEELSIVAWNESVHPPRFDPVLLDEAIVWTRRAAEEREDRIRRSAEGVDALARVPPGHPRLIPYPAELVSQRRWSQTQHQIEFLCARAKKEDLDEAIHVTEVYAGWDPGGTEGLWRVFRALPFFVSGRGSDAHALVEEQLTLSRTTPRSRHNEIVECLTWLALRLREFGRDDDARWVTSKAR